MRDLTTALIATLAAAVVGAVLMAASAILLSAGPTTTAGTSITPGAVGAVVNVRIVGEGDGSWDCRAMGDRRCGPAVLNGPFNPAATLDTTQVTDIR